MGGQLPSVVFRAHPQNCPRWANRVTWEVELTGRTHRSDHDDITGALTATRILELIWPDETTSGFAAHVYSVSDAPLNYRWSRRGDTLVHAGLGMTYTGTISSDGATITGTWLPDPDRPDMAGAAYDATMRRV